MALSRVLGPPRRHLRPPPLALLRLPPRHRSLVTTTAATWGGKKKARVSCSLPELSWEERYGFSKMTKHSFKAAST